MPIVDPINLLNGIKKKYEDAKAKIGQGVDYMNEVARQATNSPSAGFDPGGGQVLDSILTKALSAVGMNPNDIEGSKMALGILGAHAPIPEASPAVIGELPIGIGRGIVTGRKDKVAPARWERFKELYQDKFNIDIDEALKAQRQQNENVPFGASQVRVPFYTTQQRAARDNFYKSGPGSSEGGQFTVKEKFQPKMPLDMITSSEFFGPDLTKLFTGGGTTKQDRITGKYYSQSSPSHYTDPMELAASVMSPHMYRRAENARAASEAISEGTGAALANRGGIDWVYKQSPPGNKFSSHYPTQLIHTDMPALSQRMRKLQESLGIKGRDVNKTILDEEGNLKPLITLRGVKPKTDKYYGPGLAPGESMPLWKHWDQIENHPGYEQLTPAQHSDFYKTLGVLHAQSPNITPEQTYGLFDIYHQQQMKKSGNFTGSPSDVMDMIADMDFKSKGKGEKFHSSSDAIDHMYHDSPESHMLTGDQQAKLAEHIEDLYDSKPYDEPMTSGDIKDLISKTLNPKATSTAPTSTGTPKAKNAGYTWDKLVDDTHNEPSFNKLNESAQFDFLNDIYDKWQTGHLVHPTSINWKQLLKEKAIKK